MSKITEYQLTKLYYSIGEVAEFFDVNTSLIRFWEKEFSILKPKKNKKGNRLFTPKEIMKINMIYELVKEQGYTLEGAKLAIKSPKDKDEVKTEGLTGNLEIIKRLEQIKTKLIALK
ncbi:MAG: MerR family transcriptional regulator [Bacteroidetes bacterium]|nr:MerR family transcriptional regulator [Bacteroidota bacterium]